VASSMHASSPAWRTNHSMLWALTATEPNQ
jgi:hypothetical protein